jgi:putative peptidoglycan lipid II flippase
MVALVFEHGSFGPSDTRRTATAVLWYAPALLALGWREVVVHASYALGDSRRPVLVALVAMAVNVAGDLTLGPIFGISGLAASTSLSLVFAAVANTWLLGRRHGAVALRSVPGVVGRTAGAAAAGAAAGALVLRVLSPPADTGVVGNLESVAYTGLAVLGVFVAVLYIVQAPERHLLTEALRLVTLRRR